MSKTPDRFLWAADLLNIAPNERILEIGCGVGLLAEQICKRLSKGEIVTVDRSAPMIEKALSRNKIFIEKGIASFVISDFKNVTLPKGYFDTITAFNVNFFWKNSKPELENIKDLPKPTGKLVVFHQSPFEINLAAAEPIMQALLENSFEVTGTEIKRFNPTSAICIIAKPKTNG